MSGRAASGKETWHVRTGPSALGGRREVLIVVEVNGRMDEAFTPCDRDAWHADDLAYLADCRGLASAPEIARAIKRNVDAWHADSDSDERWAAFRRRSRELWDRALALGLEAEVAKLTTPKLGALTPRAC